MNGMTVASFTSGFTVARTRVGRGGDRPDVAGREHAEHHEESQRADAPTPLLQENERHLLEKSQLVGQFRYRVSDNNPYDLS